ncbi:CAP-Gly domain-containing linker protein 1 isoform X1 [Orussus abietinus]|uniref:CAP-Gly domain-containing linker protein 1 isoform X1 n=1 Tax=Orussus abietinus TaxID=222816 RepID=UPI000626B41A|nr:CAP-Gly domain-containing linker protein 1 isoform X1 [Orussus abietinus]
MINVANLSTEKAKFQRVESLSKCSVGGLPRARGLVKSLKESQSSANMQKSRIPTTVNHSPVPVAPQVTPENTPGGQQTTGIRRLPTRNAAPPNGQSSVPKSRSSSISANNATGQKRLLENQYAMKKKRYTMLKKELSEKHKNALELYTDMAQLREKVIASGAKDPGKVEEIKLTPVGQQRHILLEPGPREGFNERLMEQNSTLTEEFISELKRKLEEVPKGSVELCREALEKRREIVEWATNVGRENQDQLSPEIRKNLEEYEVEGETLQTRLEETSNNQTMLIEDLVHMSTTLWEECENNRKRIKELGNSDGNLICELKEKLEEALEGLHEEREKATLMKERKNSLEAQLQKTKTKARELETQVSNDAGKVQQLQGTLKIMETQVKQKELALEQRAKELQKALKEKEELDKHCDTLESRLGELKKKIGNKETESKSTIQEMTQKVEEVSNKLKEEKDKRQQVEASLADLQERHAKLEEKSQQLCELAEKSKNYSVTDGNHSENEIRMFNELQEARLMIQEREESLMQIKQERDEIIAAMHQAANRDNNEAAQGKLIADLVAKVDENKSLIVTVKSLQKKYAQSQQRCDHLEQKLANLQNRSRILSEVGGKTWAADSSDLQQQILDLRSNLTELARRNEELETTLTQKQLELEQRDRVMREQSKVVKVRDELIGLLKGKDHRMDGDTESHRAAANGSNRDMEQVNKQIAVKAEELQDLYSTLESKQIQVMRLEKVVKQMEEQQDRAQAQRTRLENRIAQLELTLQERSKDHRSRGFSFT